MPAPLGHAPYKGCETGGRPTKYTDEYIENEAIAFHEWLKLPDSIWYESFAIERGYTPDMFSIWSKSNEKFSGVYKYAQHWQKQKLLNGSLLNKYNSSITKLVLANTIGWTDKVEQKVTGDSKNPLSFVVDMDSRSKELIPMVEEQQIEYKADDETADS